MPPNPIGIVIHTSATPASWLVVHNTLETQRDAIAHYHTAPPPQGRGWRAIGYNWLIGRDGDYFEEVGAHVKGWNSKTIGICLISTDNTGTANDRIEDHYTRAQIATLTRRVARLRKMFPSIKWVKGHNQFANKACPMFNAERWYKGLSPTRPLAASKTLQGVTVAGTALAGTGATALSALDGNAPRLALWIFIAAGLIGLIVIWRERVLKWKRGVK